MADEHLFHRVGSFVGETHKRRNTWLFGLLETQIYVVIGHRPHRRDIRHLSIVEQELSSLV